MPTDVAVIIVNYGTADMAIAAINSVIARPRDDLSVEIHLLDNASPGNDQEMFRAETQHWGPAVTFHAEMINHGFGRGNNLVLRQLAQRPDAPRYVYLLNPDARLVSNAVADLASFLDANPKAAVVGSAILEEGSLELVTSAFRFPGVLSEFESGMNFGPVSRLLKNHIVSLDSTETLQRVDWVSGASMMARLDALTQIDYFDPDFFLYFEEVDLMRRLTKSGWEVWHFPAARIVHVGGASTGVRSQDDQRRALPAYWYDSWRLYFEKSVGRRGARRTALVRLLGSAFGDLICRLRFRQLRSPRNFTSDFARQVIKPLFT